MGADMASVLAQSIQDLLVYDIDADAVSAVESRGAHAAASIVEISQRCELVFICLPDETYVERVLFDGAGLLENSGCLRLIVDMSTLPFTSAQAFARRVEAFSPVSYVDCPISGLPKRARLGTLTMMFGGSRAKFDLVRPYLALMGEEVLHCGDVGSGQKMKAINNIMYNINIAGFCEVLPLAVKAGLDPAILEKLVTSGSARSFASEHFVPRIMNRKFDDDFPMGAAHKDITNFQQIIAELGADAPLVAAMVQTYERALEAGFGAQPKSAMIKIYERELAVKVERS